MPDPTTAAILGSTAPAADRVDRTTVPTSGFTAQLRAASATQTVSLGAMVHAGGGTAATSDAAASRPLVGVGTASLSSPQERAVAKVTSFALAQQGKPYVFATSGPDTFDCSGLMSAAYAKAGISLPAYTFTQATYGRAVDPKTEPIRPGDLIFVRGGKPPTDLGHVGMAISATQWVVAPRTGDVVQVGPLPVDRIQVVRRLIGP